MQHYSAYHIHTELPVLGDISRAADWFNTQILLSAGLPIHLHLNLSVLHLASLVQYNSLLLDKSIHPCAWYNIS